MVLFKTGTRNYQVKVRYDASRRRCIRGNLRNVAETMQACNSMTENPKNGTIVGGVHAGGGGGGVL